MTRVGLSWLTLVGGACSFMLTLALVGCSGATPRDMYFGTDAGADFDVPPRAVDSGADTTGAAGQVGSTAGAGGDTAGASGSTAGAGGDTAGASGSTAGAGGAAGAAGGTTDADTDALSDGGAG
jgi:hypothetical protein